MAISNENWFTDLSLTYRDPVTSEFVPTSVVLQNMCPEDQVDHHIRREMGGWNAGIVVALATPDALNDYKTRHPDGYSFLEERAKRALGIETSYPRILSIIPSEVLSLEHPQMIPQDTEVA